MANTYRVAIIGTGRMGGLIEDEHPAGQLQQTLRPLQRLQAIPETEVVAVANRGAERMQRFADRFGGRTGRPSHLSDYREMIEQERPDIVSVTTPSLARAEPIIFAAEHGVRGIYAEKGLCASLEEADRIAAAVRRNGVAFNWGAMRRHHDGYRQLAAAIAGGEIGAAPLRRDGLLHRPHQAPPAHPRPGLACSWATRSRSGWRGAWSDAGDPLVAAIKPPPADVSTACG